MVIAIDGPAGSGKSTLARLIAQRMGFFLLNSGYFYRAVTYLALNQGRTSDNDLVEIAKQRVFSIEDNQLYIDAQNMTQKLHTDVVDASVSKFSTIVALREILNEKMRQLVIGHDVVCEGRDMTSVVFLDANLKIYLDASVEMRAKRRFQQEYSTLSLDEIQKSIQNRDEIDKTKAVGALKVMPDAWYIDSSDKSLEDLYRMIEEKIVAIRE